MSLNINISVEIRKGFKYTLFSDCEFQVSGFQFSVLSLSRSPRWIY